MLTTYFDETTWKLGIVAQVRTEIFVPELPWNSPFFIFLNPRCIVFFALTVVSPHLPYINHVRRGRKTRLLTPVLSGYRNTLT